MGNGSIYFFAARKKGLHNRFAFCFSVPQREGIFLNCKIIYLGWCGILG